jgi:hypothetical protein
MKMRGCKILALPVVLIGVVAMGTRTAPAQDTYKVNYFDNAHLGNTLQFAKVRIDNPGLTYGNLCAMIYVFTEDQRLDECCGCIETHNGLRTLSILNDLLANPLIASGGFFTDNRGVIKVISSAVNGAGSTCDPTSGVSPRANLRLWVTHAQGVATLSIPGTTPFISMPVITETESSDSPLGATELANLQAQCAFIHILGSGQGICTCGTGD